jgi:hypothetical protein
MSNLLGSRRFCLASRRAAALFRFRHPRRRPTAALSATPSQPLQAQDCLFQLLTFLTQFVQDFGNVHLRLLYFLFWILTLARFLFQIQNRGAS